MGLSPSQRTRSINFPPLLRHHPPARPLFRFNPELAKKGQNPLTIDYAAPLSPPEPHAPATTPKPGQTLRDFMLKELRFAAILERDPETATRMEAELLADIDQRNRRLRRMVDVFAPVAPAAAAVPAPAPAADASPVPVPVSAK